MFILPIMLPISIDSRKQKVIQIFSKTNSIRKITKNHYVVDSQSSDKSYNVRKLLKTDVWTCECGDFHYLLRIQDNKHCKHIQSCIILKENIITENKIERINNPQVCPKCNSTTIVKRGFRKLKNGTKRQKYSCNQCNYKFILVLTFSITSETNHSV